MEGSHRNVSLLDRTKVGVLLPGPARVPTTDPEYLASPGIPHRGDRIRVDAPPESREANTLHGSVLDRQKIHVEERVRRKCGQACEASQEIREHRDLFPEVRQVSPQITAGERQRQRRYA